MRVSRVQAEENRQAVINTASRLFRQHGFDGIGLKDVMEAAGLTQGGFYKQFASKEDLAVQASARALETATQRWSRAAAKNPRDSLGAVIAFYLSEGHRAEKSDGCPIVALGSDVARQAPEVKAPFEAGIKAHLELLNRIVAEAGAKDSKAKALTILSMMVGTLTLARAVNDAGLAQALLKNAAKEVRKAAAA
ncbi:MAG TPA: TetR/AcrR family transcriptional regulator [Rhizomicrobium sp.]|nr:TetR/AcrR family transcriptional regulator [Rhizomicrobium sp.]